MKNLHKSLVIPFAGLKDGRHNFQFEIKKQFFDQFEYSLISSGEVSVEVELDKKVSMLTAAFSISGTVDTFCDRCTEALRLDIQKRHNLVFKFGDEESLNEDLIVLPTSAYELHLDTYVYEFINLCLPLKKVHPEGQCDEEMTAIMQKYLVNLLPEKDEENWLDEEND